MLSQEALRSLVQDARRGTWDLGRELGGYGGFLFQLEGLFHFLVSSLQKSETRNQRKNIWGENYF